MINALGRVDIVDDQGQACALVGPPDPKEWRGHKGWRGFWYGLRGRRDPSMTDPALIAESDWSMTAGGRYGFIGGLSLIGTSALARWMLSGSGTWPTWIGTIGAPLLAGVMMWPLYPPIATWFRRKMAGDIRAAYLKAGRCASCGYGLRELAEEDGLRVCPECGGVWKV